MSTEPKPDSTVAPAPRKKPYHRPKLEVHGTIADLTTHVGNNTPHIDPPPHLNLRFGTH